MKIRVTTKKPAYQTVSRGKHLVYREMMKFNFDIINKTVTSVVRDVAYEIIHDKVYDEFLNDTGNTVPRENIVSVIREKTHTIQIESMNTLFKVIDNDIIAKTDKFYTKFIDLLTHGLLLDTKAADLFELTVDDWEIMN